MYMENILNKRYTTASRVAHDIILVANKIYAPIDMLKLQHILYLVWKDYEKLTGTILFWDPFIAKRSGPVIQSVKDEYAHFGGISLYVSDKHKLLDDNIATILLKILLDGKYLDNTAGQLDKLVMGSAWKKVWDNGHGENEEIPFMWIAKEN